MKQLVFVENNRPVTDSLTVADVFDKAHDKVLRDIRELGCSEEFRLSNFGESTYTNQRGREMPCIVMTEQGFTILAMGYIGPKAMEFKERYIKEFDNMKTQLQSKVEVLSERQALIQSLRLTAELAEELGDIKSITAAQQNKLLELEHKVDEQITLDSGSQRKVQKAIARKIYDIESDPTIRSEYFRQMHREIRDRWAVASYKDVRRHELNSLLKYIDAWRPRAA